ncbi:MAG: glycosyltransferase family 1 protein [Paludibacteraceae bacterium]|nr:glycosyltransferase family 1 protein [Paludibacteraceae bacterium]MBQ8715647.1 glycosyltransferase family 1 protein [Prevotella sp.]
MKILFLVYHGFSDHSGITKKIHYQVKGLKENGYDVRLCYYDFSPEGHRCQYVDGQVLKDYGKGKWAGLRQRFDYDCVYDYCVKEGIQFVYARCFMNASPWLTHFFKKLRKAGIHTVTEIPTYPYDQEFRTFEWKMRMELKVDQLFRHSLYKYMDAMVTFSDAKVIFGQRTINISNGVDFDSIPLHHLQLSTLNTQLHLIGVAEVHPWHAFDRVMAGIGEYYSQRSKVEGQRTKDEGQRSKDEGQRLWIGEQTLEERKDVYFHVVGGVHPHHMKKYFTPLIEKYQIQDKVIFHGTLFGKELDDVFNQCQFAIGSLGRHRSGITNIKTLKNREYATRGIPFIYSEQDSDFDHQPYVIKAPADETPIDIQQIIDFMADFTMKPEEIRKTVESLQWKVQMKKVVDAVFNPQ